MKKTNLNENNFEVEHVTKTLVDNGFVERQTDDYNLNFYKKIEHNPDVKEMIKEYLFEEIFRHGVELTQ